MTWTWSGQCPAISTPSEIPRRSISLKCTFFSSCPIFTADQTDGNSFLRSSTSFEAKLPSRATRGRGRAPRTLPLILFPSTHSAANYQGVAHNPSFISRASSRARPSSHIWLAVLGVCLPVLGILRCQRRTSCYLDVLRILLLGGLGVIERAADDDFPIDDDDLIVRNRMLGIDQGGNAGVGQ